MPHRELNVYLDGTPVGTLAQTDQGDLQFSYDNDYLSRGVPTPLSLSIPTHTDFHRGKNVRAYLDNLLPDNDGVRKDWGRRYSVSHKNPFALLEHVGRDTPGAVQILPPREDADDAAQRNGDIEWLSDSDVHGMVRELAEHSEDWNPGRYGGRWSLSGGQAKIALYRDPTTLRWGVPRDSTPTTHIIKPPLPDHPQHHVNEVLCLKAARGLGMDTAGIEMIDDGNTRAVVVSRYDRRTNRSGRLARLHQEDLCQALSVMAENKYQSDGGPGLADASDLFRAFSDSDRDYSRRAFMRALAYNVAIGGTDAHAKNYSIMLAGDRARLAPLYDIGSAAPQPQLEMLRSPMKVGRDWKMNNISEKNWRKAAQRMGMDQDEVLGIVDDVNKGLPEALEKAKGDLPDSAQDEAGRVTDYIIAHAEGRWRPTLDTHPGGLYPKTTSAQQAAASVSEDKEPEWLRPGAMSEQPRDRGGRFAQKHHSEPDSSASVLGLDGEQP